MSKTKSGGGGKTPIEYAVEYAKEQDAAHELSWAGKFRGELYETGARCGLKILSDEVCCQLLAWVYLYGGGREEAVFNERLRMDIFEAQKRVNILGGEPPNAPLAEKLKGYVKELLGDYTEYTFSAGCNIKYARPAWLAALEKRYGIALQSKDYREEA